MGRETEALPDHLRCKRTDGRQWRCGRRVLEGKKLCEIHHLQGHHRQHKLKVPESLKLQRKTRKARAIVGAAAEIRVRKEDISSKSARLKRKTPISGGESDSAVKKRKVKRGDLSLELIRMVLKREVEKRKKQKKKKKKKKEQEAATEDFKSDNEGSSNSEGELMRNLPNGLMAIPPPRHIASNGTIGSCSSPRDVKIGDDSSVVARRCFRSKNIEPMPIGKLQVLPCKKDLGKLRKGKKKCHWCRRSGLSTLIRCSSCRKEFYCMDCIKDQYAPFLVTVYFNWL